MPAGRRSWISLGYTSHWSMHRHLYCINMTSSSHGRHWHFRFKKNYNSMLTLLSRCSNSSKYSRSYSRLTPDSRSAVTGSWPVCHKRRLRNIIFKLVVQQVDGWPCLLELNLPVNHLMIESESLSLLIVVHNKNDVPALALAGPNHKQLWVGMAFW